MDLMTVQKIAANDSGLISEEVEALRHRDVYLIKNRLYKKIQRHFPRIKQRPLV
jgi:hypothetical protein